MKPISKCPDESILKAVVLGEINEPLLDYYLDHIDGCKRCTEIIDKSSWPQLEFQSLVSRSHLKKADLKPTTENVDSAWLESLKKNFPASDFIPANNPDNALGLPEVIGNYRLTTLIGDGATSIVYQAVDMNLHREVALKILHPEFDGVPEIQESILSEARAIASLHHENILPIFHVEKLGTNPVLVFPLLPGCTLQKALEQQTFSLRETLVIIRDLCRALEYIHSRGIIHRDIKPSNIWLGTRADGSHKALLFDFGFAGMEQNRSGTSGYMAPEQIRHQKNSPATDMFALGSLLFQMTGQGKAPEKIKNTIHQLLSENPADRPTAAQLSRVLDAWLNPKRKVTLALGAFSALAVGMLFLLKSSPPPETKTLPVAAQTPPVQAQESKPLHTPVHMFQGKAGYASALSGNGRAFVRHKTANDLEYFGSPGEKNPLEIQANFPVAFMELNSDGRLLALTGNAGQVEILRMPQKKRLHASNLSVNCQSMAWAGIKSDILVINLGGKPHYLSPDKGTETYVGNFEELPAISPNMKNIPLLQNFSASPKGPLLALQYSDQSVMVWSFEENQMVQIAPSFSNSSYFTLGWRNPETYCMYQDRKVVEICTAKENTQKSKLARDMDIWELSSTPKDVCWIKPSQVVFLSDLGGSRPKIFLGKRGSHGKAEDFYTGPEFIQKLKALDTPGTFAAFAAHPSTSVLIFDIQTPPVR